jgi:hypothetical protein
MRRACQLRPCWPLIKPSPRRHRAFA